MELNERIKSIRMHYEMSQEEFGIRLGLARNTITNYETGNRVPSNQVYLSICREFNVEYEWLTEGTGEMFHQSTDGDLLCKISDLLESKDEFTRNFFKTFADLPEEDWVLIKQIAEKLLSKQ